MTFMDRLSANPTGSGIYGQPKRQRDDTEKQLSIVKQLKDREMQDFQKKAQFMSELSLQQDRQRRIFDTQQQEQNPQKMDVVFQDPNYISPTDKAELGIKQQGLNLESQRLSQSGKLGQEALDIKQSQHDLNQQKSDQINALKQADLERATTESNNKLKLTQAELDRKIKSGEDTLELRRELAAAMEERHKLEMAMKQQQLEISNQQRDASLKAEQDRLNQNRQSTTTEELNPDGTKRITTTQRGAPAKRVKVVGPKGESGTIEEGDTLPTGWSIAQ